VYAVIQMKTGLISSEYEIIKAIPTSTTFKEIADKTGLSLSYVSRQIRKLYTEKSVRYYFKPIYSKMGLELITVFLPYKLRNIERLRTGIPYILSLSHIIDRLNDYLLVIATPPKKYTNIFIEYLPDKPIKIYRNLIEFKWRPDLSKLSKFEDGDIYTNWKNFYEEYNKSLSENILSYKEIERLDNIDLYIISDLTLNAFKSMSDIATKFGFSQQLASYHYHKHVLKVWDYNAVKILFSLEEVPVKFYQFALGDYRSAWAFSKTLAQSPFTISTLLSENKPEVLWISRLPCVEEVQFHKTLKELKTILDDMEYLGYMDTDLLLRWTIPLNVIKKGEWIFKPIKVYHK